MRIFGEYVVVLPSEPITVTEGGLEIPDVAQEKPLKGTVVAVGDTEGIDLKEGQIVLYGAFAGVHIELDGVVHLFMREQDVFATV